MNDITKLQKNVNELRERTILINEVSYLMNCKDLDRFDWFSFFRKKRCLSGMLQNIQNWMRLTKQ